MVRKTTRPPQATVVTPGIARLADTAGVAAGVNTLNAITPGSLFGALGVAAGIETVEQAFGAGAIIVAVNHGLTRQPKWVMWFLRCKTAELGYSVGDEVAVVSCQAGTSWASWISSAQIGINFTTTPQLPNKGTGVYGAITVGNWRLVGRTLA